MQGGGSALYKLNLTALYFTFCGLVLAAIAGLTLTIALLVSNAARAQSAPTIEASSQVMPDFPPELLPMAVTLIEQHGWHCDSISAARQWMLSRGFTVVCNHYSYEYDIQDRGGNLEVTLK
jgi:ABC-type nitrate/sulfonate/bicarbonate transport system permease component